MPVIVPRNYEQMRALYQAELERLARCLEAHFEAKPGQPAYLQGCRHTGIDTHNPAAWVWSALEVGPDERAEESWTYVRTAPVTDARNRGLANMWVNYLPILKLWLDNEPLWIFAD